jgi:sigma-B regulation protein RsbU (phosphoserine phosphatase)
MAKSKILIVDDEPFNIDYIEQELEDSGYETISAGDGQEALDKVQRDAPDLILLDIMMPIMDGFEVLARLKANPETRETPVIVISASNDLKSVVRGIKLGAEDYLPKPFEPTLLSARISSSLEKKQLRDLQKLYLKSLERELELGREIQLGFLPPQLPEVEGWEIAAYFKAAREVAGDYYDAFLLPDGNLTCVVGDVVGKGVGAALYMSLFRSLIRATSKSDYFYHNPGVEELNNVERLQHVISFVNNYVAETHGHTSMFSTVFMCIINPRDNRLTYINGGNEPAILMRSDGEIHLLWPTGPIVGVIPQAGFSAKEMVMGENDLLLAYTDGVTDALNIQEEAFGRERLVELLQGERTNGERLLKKIERLLQQFTGEAVQFDDITTLAVKRSGKN